MIVVRVFGVEATISAMTNAIARADSGSIYVGSDSPYARRIELGFTGHDSLGRYYDQAPRPYLLPAFLGVEQVIPAMIMTPFMMGGTAMEGLREGADAMAEIAQMLVAVDTGELRDSIVVGDV